MKNQLKKITLIAGLAAASAFTALAQPYYIAGNGITPNWTTTEPGATPMSGGPLVYTVTLPTVANAYHEFKAASSNWVSSWPGNNVKIKGDATGTNTFYFYPGTPGDGWLPTANRVGYADPGNLTWEIMGSMNSWTDGFDTAARQMVNQGNGLYTVNYVVTNAGTYEFKFRTPGTWSEQFIGTTFENGGANIFFTTTNSPQTVPFQLDLPNGRFLVGSLVAPPVTNQVTFLVDMSVEQFYNRFDPSVDRVNVSGAFNGWPGTATNALILTNVPTWGGNTNIYYATAQVSGTPSSFASEYKFTSTSPAWGGTGGYEPRPQNRSFNYLPTNGPLVLPVVLWGDAGTNDYLSAATLVTFSVNMAFRTSISNVTFDPALHLPPYVNGNFLTNSWIGSWNPISLADNQMTENPIGSTNYTFAYMVPRGHLVRAQYKYGFSDGVNSIDNEAPSLQDHARYIRQTGTGSYTMPNDLFGNQYNEPSFGELAAGPASGGNVPVRWLGRPGVRLQSTANLAGGIWVNHTQTDGTNWSTGTGSTNGFVSRTNVPAIGAQFFRLISQ